MHPVIDRIKRVRLFFLEQINGLTTDQMNQIPAGFHNNMAWHLSHLLISQQMMIYARLSLPIALDEPAYEIYKPGGKPGPDLTASEIEERKLLFLSLIEKLEADYSSGLFNDYKPWKNRYGMDINNIEDALGFLMFHEGFHCGYVMAQKHALT